MRFRSARMMHFERHFEEEEMLKFAYSLIYESKMNTDQIRAHFAEEFGDENLYLIDEILIDEIPDYEYKS